MREPPKLWNDWLQKALDCCGFKASHEAQAVYYGHGMTITVYVDDVLFFGPSEPDMETVITELQDTVLDSNEKRVVMAQSTTFWASTSRNLKEKSS